MKLIYTPPITSSGCVGVRRRTRNSIYVGGKDCAKNIDELNKAGIKFILNVTPEKDSGIKSGVPNYFPSTFTYKRIPVYDTQSTNLIDYATEITAFVSKALHHGSILVHCQKGVSRSVTCILLYLVQKHKMTYDQALKLVKRRHAQADPIPSFLEQVKQLAEREGCVKKYKVGYTKNNTTPTAVAAAPSCSASTSNTDSSDAASSHCQLNMKNMKMSEGETDASTDKGVPKAQTKSESQEAETDAKTEKPGSRNNTLMKTAEGRDKLSTTNTSMEKLMETNAGLDTLMETDAGKNFLTGTDAGRKKLVESEAGRNFIIEKIIGPIEPIVAPCTLMQSEEEYDEERKISSLLSNNVTEENNALASNNKIYCVSSSTTKRAASEISNLPTEKEDATTKAESHTTDSDQAQAPLDKTNNNNKRPRKR